MAIKNLAERYPEIGRIRLGERETTDKGKERPKKGENLRFTSNDDTALKAIAAQHGGEVVAWEKGEQAWQLTSETEWIEALLPSDPLADTPIYERWGSGGVQRRCDGERCLIPVGSGDGGHLDEVDCQCVREGLTPGDRKDKGACSVTIRIRLVLPYVPGIGVWLCTSHSWMGALELPGQVAVIEAMRERGQLIPVLFGIEKRTVKKPWEQYRRDFIVPSVRISQSLAQLQGSGELMPRLDAVSVHGALPAAATPSLPAGSAPFTDADSTRAPRVALCDPGRLATIGGRIAKIRAAQSTLAIDMAKEWKTQGIQPVSRPERFTVDDADRAESLILTFEEEAAKLAAEPTQPTLDA